MDGYEELIAATDAALEARPSLVVRGEEELAKGLHENPHAYQVASGDWGAAGHEVQQEFIGQARALIESGVVTVVPSLVAASREAVEKEIGAHERWLDQTACYVGGCICGWKEPVRDGDTFDAHVADALLAPGGPARLADATPEEAWDELFSTAYNGTLLHDPHNPYDGFTRKEQNDGE